MNCPRCSSEGPFERVNVALDGSYRTLLCPSCHLSWKAFG